MPAKRRHLQGGWGSPCRRKENSPPPELNRQYPWRAGQRASALFGKGKEVEKNGRSAAGVEPTKNTGYGQKCGQPTAGVEPAIPMVGRPWREVFLHAERKNKKYKKVARYRICTGVRYCGHSQGRAKALPCEGGRLTIRLPCRGQQHRKELRNIQPSSRKQ